MDTVIVRPARTSEQKSLEQLQWRASLGNPGDREALLAHPDAIDLPIQQIESGFVYVAERGSVVVGFAAILKRGDGNSELDALFVEPSAWRTGVGRALVEHCASEARKVGATLLHVIGNPHAQGFYSACGFTVCGTTQTRFGPGLLLERRLCRDSP